MDKDNYSDIENFYQKLKAALGDEWSYEELGTVEGYPLPLITEKKKKGNSKNILIAAGFHGDEVAGIWAILEFLESKSAIPKNINLTFLPLVNPTGFVLNKRFNRWDENPNRGYCHKEIELNKNISKEGEILLKNIDLIKSMTRDGFLTLHEDVLSEKLYVYTFEKSENPGEFSKMLLGVGRKYFESYGNEIVKDNFGKYNDDTIVKDGLSFNKHDGSFEDYLFDSGVKETACTETPGKGEEVSKRITANLAILKSFINYFEKK